MATLKEFEEALRQNGMHNALAILEQLKKRDREQRSIAPARRITGRKMTAELARTVVEMHATTGLTQQEIAFKLGVNQGRVNEVIKRGKWLSGDPQAPEIVSRDKAMQRLTQRAKARRAVSPRAAAAQAQQPSVSAPTVVSTARVKEAEHRAGEKPVTPSLRELPFASMPHPIPAQKASHAHKETSRRMEDVKPVVSAQLAFMDL